MGWTPPTGPVVPKQGELQLYRLLRGPQDGAKVAVSSPPAPVIFVRRIPVGESELSSQLWQLEYHKRRFPHRYILNGSHYQYQPYG